MTNTRLLKGQFNVNGTKYLGKLQHFFTEGSVWKDGNKLGEKKTKEIQKEYSEMIEQRIKDIKENPEEHLVTLSDILKLKEEDYE